MTGDSRIAVDSSVAIAYLIRSHAHHEVVARHLHMRIPVLTGHSLAETYAVLTRLPDDGRYAPLDASELIDANFDEVVTLAPADSQRLHRILSDRDISGGAVYDALVALTALRAGLPLATRDRRALPTYAKLGANVELVLA